MLRVRDEAANQGNDQPISLSAAKNKKPSLVRERVRVEDDPLTISRSLFLLGLAFDLALARATGFLVFRTLSWGGGLG